MKLMGWKHATLMETENTLKHLSAWRGNMIRRLFYLLYTATKWSRKHNDHVEVVWLYVHKIFIKIKLSWFLE